MWVICFYISFAITFWLQPPVFVRLFCLFVLVIWYIFCKVILYILVSAGWYIFECLFVELGVNVVRGVRRRDQRWRHGPVTRRRPAITPQLSAQLHRPRSRVHRRLPRVHFELLARDFYAALLLLGSSECCYHRPTICTVVQGTRWLPERFRVVSWYFMSCGPFFLSCIFCVL